MMNVAQARVVDPVLTNVARGYKNSRFAGMSLFPYVPVSVRGGRVITFGREAFRLYNTGRAPGAVVKRVSMGYSSDPYALEQHALSGTVPFELMEDARQTPGIDLGSAAVGRTQDIIGLSLEHAQAQLARDPRRYADGSAVECTEDTVWTNAESNPVLDIERAKEVVRSKIGMRPNTLLIGGIVFAALKIHPVITDRIKYTSRDVATPELLAALFGVDQVVVGDAVYEDETGALADVWGGDAILAYTNTFGVSDAGSPSFGYTYRLSGSPLVEEPYQDRDTRSWVYPVVDDVVPVVAGADAGFLLQGAVSLELLAAPPEG